ncbi:hypothetical protein LCGC14_0472030 [marine sediment metagenome]|uniref:Uncharacterized protein n=1 Tax=marine sediment metagenome TaxID=412755 RepID=A0A0F9SUT6_9ZZZZ
MTEGERIEMLRIQAALKAALAGDQVLGNFLAANGRTPHCCDPLARLRQGVGLALGWVQTTLKQDDKG